MSTGTLTPSPWQTVLDDDGNPVSGAKVYTYVAGTTTLVATYTDVDLSVANANPIIADTAGRYVAFLSPGSSYKFIVKTSADVVIRTQDNIATTTSANVDITGTAGEALTAGMPVYLSDGSNSKTAGSWYQADASFPYASTTCIIGFVPATIASGANGTIRRGGIIEEQSGLTVGTTYYVSETAGSITATAPANSRRVGVADTTTSLVLAIDGAIQPVDVSICQGRLTLTTALPVTVADVTAATSIFWTPY